jgi:hypothetical protein
MSIPNRRRGAIEQHDLAEKYRSLAAAAAANPAGNYGDSFPSVAPDEEHLKRDQLSLSHPSQ